MRRGQSTWFLRNQKPEMQWGTVTQLGKGEGDTLTDGTSSIIPATNPSLGRQAPGGVTTTSTMIRANKEGVTSTLRSETVWPKGPKGMKRVVKTTTSAPRFSGRDHWYHMASVKTGTRNKLYVNGAFVAETYGKASLADQSLEVLLGGLKKTGHGWMGEVDELAFWRRALNAKEVRARRHRRRC